MGTSNQKKKSLPDGEQVNKQANNIKKGAAPQNPMPDMMSLPDGEQENKQANNIKKDAAPQNPMPDIMQSSDWKQMTSKDFWTKPMRMKTGCNGIDMSKQYEETDIKTVKQAIQLS